MPSITIQFDRNTVTLAIAGVGCLVGVASLLLGLYNFRRAITKDKITLAVTAKKYVGLRGEDSIMLEVVNIGFRPVSIAHVGFDLPDRRVLKAGELHDLDGGGLPKQIEPQARIRVHFQPGCESSEAFQAATHCFAVTVAGQKFRHRLRLAKDDVTIYRKA